MFSKIFPSLATRAATPNVGLPPDTRLYCVGDIHGCHQQLLHTQRKIADDVNGYPGRGIVVYLGDYIDRGPESRQVVQHLLENPLPQLEAVHLLGNHEQVFMQFLDAADLPIAHVWLQFGGLATLQSYGIALHGIPTVKDLPGLHSDLLVRVPDKHRQFYRHLRPFYELGGYFFAHAGIRPRVKLHRQRLEDLLWIRDEFLQSPLSHGKIIVHGHTVTAIPDIQPNRIGLDTGAYATGILTCAVFEGEAVRIL